MSLVILLFWKAFQKHNWKHLESFSGAQLEMLGVCDKLLVRNREFLFVTRVSRVQETGVV